MSTHPSRVLLQLSQVVESARRNGEIDDELYAKVCEAIRSETCMECGARFVPSAVRKMICRDCDGFMEAASTDRFPPLTDPHFSEGEEVRVEIDIDEARPLDDIDQDFGANANNRWDD